MPPIDHRPFKQPQLPMQHMQWQQPCTSTIPPQCDSATCLCQCPFGTPFHSLARIDALPDHHSTLLEYPCSPTYNDDAEMLSLTWCNSRPPCPDQPPSFRVPPHLPDHACSSWRHHHHNIVMVRPAHTDTLSEYIPSSWSTPATPPLQWWRWGDQHHRQYHLSSMMSRRPRATTLNPPPSCMSPSLMNHHRWWKSAQWQLRRKKSM